MTIGIISLSKYTAFSIDSYTAYEASTAELDDVIRIQDDNNRASLVL